jgi:hypothetical protein
MLAGAAGLAFFAAHFHSRWNSVAPTGLDESVGCVPRTALCSFWAIFDRSLRELMVVAGQA